ncbi:MAG: ATP-binding cassette domain-containing protein [Candidatus Lokiarchaeota archaeon]|nr:ATP-binding cassette domain-containing protein [Candidatus Lokiarchaeota archaeon]MBD3239292.1 ATP-binding cassette domain-containing protein [Chitinivibrionales bacterium]
MGSVGTGEAGREPPLYSLEGVTKCYKSGEYVVHALRGVDLKVPQGTFISIVGPSGSGKSTLLHILGMLDLPTSGTVRFMDAETTGLGDQQRNGIRNRSIGFIFQRYHLIPVLNVEENMKVPFLERRGVDWTAVNRRVSHLIEAIGLDSVRDHRPNQLSGGQQQRVAIGRALATSPVVVLADEPTANLDTTTSTDIIKLMRRLNEEEGCSFVFSTHDSLVMDYSDEIVRIRDGMLEGMVEA